MKTGTFTSPFWEKVSKCKHKNESPTYYDSGNCWTPYCSWSETRCADCGVYIQTCDCQSSNGMSGWPEARWRAHERSKHQKRIEARNA